MAKNADAKNDAKQAAAGKPDAGDKGESKKVDMAEEAHWRIDELARQVADLQKTIKDLEPGLRSFVQITDFLGRLITARDAADDVITKVGTMETPDGVHTMTVRETRSRRK